jgi:hypothetical protein
MLVAADMAYRPSHSELAEQGWIAPDHDVTHAMTPAKAGWELAGAAHIGADRAFADQQESTFTVGYTEAKRAEYPKQDEQELLTEFTAELMARLEYGATAHAGVSWEAWLDGGSFGGPHDRLEPFRETAKRLASLGMLTWPEDTRDAGVGWTVQYPGRSRGAGRAPELDYIHLCGTKPEDAMAYARALTLTGVPNRLVWQFSSREPS